MKAIQTYATACIHFKITKHVNNFNDEGKILMDTSSLHHRPESEYAYLYEENRVFIRLRTKAGDVKSVNLLGGDVYKLYTDNWYTKGTPMKKIATTHLHDYWAVETTVDTKRLAYGFHVSGIDSTEVFYCDRGVYPMDELYLKEVNYYFRLPFFHEVDRFKSPQWVKETVWYQIFPDRFANGDPSNDPEDVLPWGSKKHPGQDDFYGGDLQGIIDNLDYLEDLGINGLYLTPIFQAPTNHKYDTTDYMEIDSAFGDKEILKKLIADAHSRGMRVMLDAVFNHIGYDSVQWQDVLKNQEKSRYKDWFHIRSFPVPDYNHLKPNEMNEMYNLNYDAFAFAGHMPKLNTANPEVKEHLLNIATYWIREFDIDGWRLDVANEVDHAFWKEFYAACVAEKEDIYILGEIWHSGQKWLEGDEFHAIMNYVFTEKIEDYFLRKIVTPIEMIYDLNQQTMLYRQQTNEVQFNLLDSHDTARLLTKAYDDKDLVKSILTFMFAQQGTPCIYYGTEVGLDGHHDPDCRKCMIWDEKQQDKLMHQFMKALIAFRKQYQPILSYGLTEWFDVRDDEDIIGFTRTHEGEQLMFYFSQNKQEVEILVPETAKPVLSHLSHFENGKLVVERNGFAIFSTAIQ